MAMSHSGLVLSSPSGLAMVVMVDVSASGIAAIYVLSDPEKLAQLAVH
jgi:hypothetical protein